MRKFQLLIVAGAAIYLSGCALEQWYPERFDTIEEVYAPGVSERQLNLAPAPSRISAEFDAPYADVFAVAERSVTQNQWNLHSSDEASGTILATRVTKGQFRTPNGYLPADRHYHYLVRIDEVSGSVSSLAAVVKTQGACKQINRAAFGAMTLGMSEAAFNSEMKDCKEDGSKTTWAQGEASVKGELDNLVILMRNNLIALGY